MVDMNCNYEKIRGMEKTVLSNVPNIKCDNPNNETDKTVKQDIYQPTQHENTGIYSQGILKTGNAELNSILQTAYDLKNIPNYLAAKMAGIGVNSNGNPIINSASDYANWQDALNRISGNHSNLYVNSKYKYTQTGSNNYGFGDPQSACAAFAFATALSIKYNKTITPDDLSVRGSSLSYANETRLGSVHVYETTDKQYKGYEIEGTESDIFLAIDAQLQLGNPALIHVKTDDGLEHWATVIGKKDDVYTVIDPWDGRECSLDEMEIRCNHMSSSSFVSCMIISDQY